MTDAAITMNDELATLEQRVKDGTATRGMKSRLGRIKKQRERESLGSLYKLLREYEFRDGALYRARLKPSRPIVAYVAEPQWSSLQVLDLSHHTLQGVPTADFINSMPGLHTLRGLDRRAMPTSACPGVTDLEVGTDWASERLAMAFPNLKRLSVGFVEQPQAFWSHDFCRSLECVTIGSLTWTRDTLRSTECYGLSSYAETIDCGPPLRRLELPEDVLLESGELYSMGAALAAARRKGAEVIIVPGEPQPPTRFLY